MKPEEQPDFSTLKLADEQPDFATLKPAESSVVPPQQSLSDKIWGVVNKVAKVGDFVGVGGLGRGVASTIFQATPEARTVEKLAQEGKITPQEFEEISTGGVTPKEVVGSAIQTGATFIPGVSGGAGVAKKALAGGFTGYLFDVGGNLQKNEDLGEALEPGLGTATGTLLPILGRITGLSTPGKTAEATAKQLEEYSLKLTPVDKQNLFRQGEDIADYLSKKKIVGTPEMRFDKINSLYGKMEERVQEIIKGSGQKFDKNKIIQELQAIPSKYRDDIIEYPEVVSKVDKIIQTLRENFLGETISAEHLNKIKRSAYSNAYAKNATDVINEVSHDVGDVMKSNLDTAIDGLKNLNKEYGTLITARKALFKAQSRQQAGLVAKLASMVGGSAVGGAVAGPGGAGVGALVAPQIAETVSTPVRSAVGAGLQTASEIIEKLPTDQLGNLQLTKKALFDLIQQLRSS